MLNIVKRFFSRFFGSKRTLKLGIYGPPNSGKTTLANKICVDCLGEEIGSVSNIAHETRKISVKENVVLKTKKGGKIVFNLVDTPGIATKIDFEDFVKQGISVQKAKKRAREATKGVIEAIKWLDDMNGIIVVLDATQDPYSQVNITTIGNIAARKIPMIIAANKMDLKKASVKKVQNAFPQYSVIGISAKYGKNFTEFYDALYKTLK